MIIKKTKAKFYSRKGLEGLYYLIKDQMGGITISRSTFTAEHGQRTIGARPRIYYIIKGKAKFVLNSKEIFAQEGDLIIVEPKSTYNLYPLSKKVDTLLICELLDLDKLPR